VKRPSFATLVTVAITCTVLASSGCSGSQKIGGGVKLGQGGNANLNVGASASAHPTPTATHRTAPVHRQVAPRVTATPTAAPRQTASAPKPKPFVISINGDTSGQPGFSPAGAAVYVGTQVVWVNHDTVPRGVVAQNGAFRSPVIAPGKSYTWIATAAGKYNYQDSTRPYVDGQVQVYPK
jgi:plastocyanin